jgi:serine/threonine protein kinase
MAIEDLMQDLEDEVVFGTQLSRDNLEGVGASGAFYWNGSKTGVKVIPIVSFKTSLYEALTEAVIGEYLTKPTNQESDERLEGIVKHLDHTIIEKENKQYVALQIEHAGTSLTQIMEDKSIKNRGIFRVLSRVGGALSLLHEKGIHYADLSPNNIYCHTQDRRVTDAKIGDFGHSALVGDNELLLEIAKTKELNITHLTKQDQLVGGTYPYLAPEHNEKRRLENDIYSLGLITYELFTGISIGEKLKNVILLPKNPHIFHNKKRNELFPQFEQAVDDRLSKLKLQYSQAIDNFKYLVKSALDYRLDRRPKVEQIHQYTKAIYDAMHQDINLRNTTSLEALNQETLEPSRNVYMGYPTTNQEDSDPKERYLVEESSDRLAALLLRDYGIGN